MAGAEKKPEESQSKKSLESSLERLMNRAKQRSTQDKGLSKTFTSQVNTEEEALELCAAAMDTLATSFVEALTEFKAAAEPKAILSSLDRSEALWEEHASVIRALDGSGEEIRFINEMRLQSIQILENKLEEVSREAIRTPTDGLSACILAIVGTMDNAFKELGHPKESQSRRRLNEIAHGYATKD